MTSFSGAGEGVSRRRLDSQSPVHLCLLFIAMFFSYLLLCVSPFIKLLLCGGGKIRSSMRRRQIRRFIEPPLSASLALRLVFSSALSLEFSSAAAVQCFSGKSPDVFFTGDCRTSLGASASSVKIPVRTPYSQRSPLFLPPGTDELFRPPFEAPLTPSDTRSGSSPWLDLKSFRSFLSLSFPTMMMPAFSLLRSLVGRRQSSLGDSSFNGGGKFSLGYECILGLSADIGPHLPFFWAWPTKLLVKDIIQSMPQDAHPSGAFVSAAAMSALSLFYPDANPSHMGQDIYKSKQVRDKQIFRILGQAPTIAANAFLRTSGKPPVLPSSNFSYAENVLYMLDSMGNKSYRPNPRLARVLDIVFILHAEHEMNCSTAAARHLASSGVDVYAAISGAVGALYGPLHGGATDAVSKMLSEIGTVENIPDFIQCVKNKKRRLSGFGHRVYKNYDPRAKVVKKLAYEVFSIVGKDPLIEVAVALEKAALSDEYFVKRKLYPNVDFYSGLVYRAMGIPPQFIAVPRMAGYLAHWLESLDDPDTKIMRPQQVYTGVWLRHYAPVK